MNTTSDITTIIIIITITTSETAMHHVGLRTISHVYIINHFLHNTLHDKYCFV